MDIEISFEGHGLWGVGGGAGVIPDDGVYAGNIDPETVEFRGSRSNPQGTKKLYFTVVHDSGYAMYDNVSLPTKGAKPGVEKAFARFLLAIGYIEATETNVEAVTKGGLKGKKITLKSVTDKMKEGPKVWFDFKKPRGEGDYKQTTYLVESEIAAIQSGEIVIGDNRSPFSKAPAGATPAVASPLGGLPGGASAPITPAAPMVAGTTAVGLVAAQPNNAAAGAVDNLLSL
jgi:hypothetical protein